MNLLFECLLLGMIQNLSAPIMQQSDDRFKETG